METRLANAPLDLHVSRPQGSSLVRGYVSKDPAASSFYLRHFEDPAAFEDKAREVDTRFDRAARERVVESIIVPPDGDASRLERFVDEGGYMVTTGQQPGLFGGPLYSIHKALTAVRLAEAVEARLERPVLPLFWVASDDHDWGEACHASLVGVDNELHRFELPSAEPDRSPPLHRIRLGEEADGQVDALLRCLPETDFSGTYVDLVRAGFGAGSTLPEGFHALMQGILGRFGLFFTDAAHPAVKRDSAELLLSELDRAAELEGILAETGRALDAAGFSLQVPILEGGVNLFLEGPAGRERLYRDGAGFRQRISGRALSRDEVRRAAEEDPSTLSPNVLLRPVVESALFPTLSYVGGPGEMAYFGQLAPYFEAHGIEMPIVHPRWAVTPVERKVQKVLDKFEVAIADLQRPFHEIAGDFARDEVPDDVRAALGKLRGAIGAGVGELQNATKSVDPTLKGPVNHVRSQSFAALDELEKKVVAAVKRETDIALAQLEKAQVHLYPGGQPVERVESPMYFLARYGDAYLDALYDRLAVNFE